jgi:hypothetical protein
MRRIPSAGGGPPLRSSTKRWLLVLIVGVVFAALGSFEVWGDLTEDCLEGTEYERGNCVVWPRMVIVVALVAVPTIGLVANLCRHKASGRH